jgi:hypothetical protein
MKIFEKNEHKRQSSKINSKNEMRKSTSEKILRRIIRELSDNSIDDY